MILALLTFLFLPVLAVEPIYLGGSFGKQWLNNFANTNPDLGTWGNQPLASYYPYYVYPYSGNYFHLAKLNPGIAPYYGNWIPYTLFDTGNFNNPYYSGHLNNFTLPLSSFSKLNPGIAPYYGSWIPYTLY